MDMVPEVWKIAPCTFPFLTLKTALYIIFVLTCNKFLVSCMLSSSSCFSFSSMSFKMAAGEALHGVYTAPQNKEESRKNVEQVLQFISSRHIRMPHISAQGKLREKYIFTEPFNQISTIWKALMESYSFLFALGGFNKCLLDHFCPPVLALWTVPSLPADIVDGNLKSVMRIILALAAHFKPSANHRAVSGNAGSLTRGTSSHNPLSPIALAQGAAAALASARHDVSQPAHATSLPRYPWRRTQMYHTHVVSAVLCWTNSENLIKDLLVIFVNKWSAISRQLGVGHGKERVCSCTGSAVWKAISRWAGSHSLQQVILCTYNKICHSGGTV